MLLKYSLNILKCPYTQGIHCGQQLTNFIEQPNIPIKLIFFLNLFLSSIVQGLNKTHAGNINNVYI